MSLSLIRSRAMITKTIDRHRWEEVADGAVLQQDGVIKDVGTYRELRAKYPQATVLGTGNEILLPGFVNGHHHIGLTPVQLGSPDMPLELWFVTRMVTRNLNLYLDTLYSAFEMIASGITTVQHIHGWMPGTPTEVEAKSAEVIRAYEDVGMRVSYCYAVRDQNRLVYQADEEFIAAIRRAHAYAPARDRLPEGIRLAPRQVQRARLHRPLRHGEPTPDGRARGVAQ